MIIYLTTHLFSLSSGPLHHTVYAIYNNLHQVHFDFDVDNYCLATMSPNKNHFKDLKLRQIGECISIGTGLTVAVEGTFTMNIEDDDGRNHKIEIPNSLYVLGLHIVLLSPLHWAQQAQDTVHDPMGTCLVNGHLSCTLYWSENSRKKSPSMTLQTLHLFIQHLDTFIIEPFLQPMKPWRHVIFLMRKPSYCQT